MPASRRPGAHLRHHPPQDQVVERLRSNLGMATRLQVIPAQNWISPVGTILPTARRRVSDGSNEEGMQTARPCSVNGCDRRQHARAFCTAHYRRWMTYGDPGEAAIGSTPATDLCPHCGVRPRHAAKRYWTECNRALTKLWRERNREQNLESARKWYARNREGVLQKRREWKDRNPDKVRAQQQRWRAANPEVVRAQHRRSRESHAAEITARKREAQRRPKFEKRG